MQQTRYVVMTTAAHIPGAARSYDALRVALIEMEPGFGGRPAAISVRAPGVRRIVRDFGCGGLPAVAAAEALKARLEAGRQ